MEKNNFVKVSQLIDPKKGKKVSSSKIKTPNSIPYLLIDTLRGDDPEFFTEDKKYVEAIPEDILIVGDGANSGLVGTGVKGAVGSTIIRLRKKVDDLENNYLTYFLKLYFEQLRSDIKGSGTPHLKIDKLLKMEIRKPSSQEQQKIVSAIETQFSRLDETIENLNSIKRKIGTYKKAVLKKAFEGDYKEDLIGNILKTTSGGTPSRGKKEYYFGNIPWLKSGELRDNKQIEDSEEHITEEAIRNSSAKIFPEKTVLIAMYGATIGKVGILKKSCSTNQAVCGFLPNENYLPNFIFYYLLNKKRNLIFEGKGGAQPNISQTVIKSLKIPLCSIKEQQKIVQEIESKFSVIDKLEQIVEQSLKKAERLRKSILKVAFEGRLIKE